LSLPAATALDWTGTIFGPETNKDAKADNINRHHKIFIYELLFVLWFIWGRPSNTTISFCVYPPVKNSITLTPNMA
jgi:hypothetical protein